MPTMSVWAVCPSYRGWNDGETQRFLFHPNLTRNRSWKRWRGWFRRTSRNVSDSILFRTSRCWPWCIEALPVPSTWTATCSPYLIPMGLDSNIVNSGSKPGTSWCSSRMITISRFSMGTPEGSFLWSKIKGNPCFIWSGYSALHPKEIDQLALAYAISVHKSQGSSTLPRSSHWPPTITWCFNGICFTPHWPGEIIGDPDRNGKGSGDGRKNEEARTRHTSLPRHFREMKELMAL